jgi:hypothetical protein
LLRELKPGARIISNTFDMGDWKPEKTVAVDDSPSDENDYSGLSKTLYMWTVPARK